MFSSPRFTTKQKEKSLINSYVTSHDLTCDCSNPAFHCALILLKHLGPELNQQDKQQLKKCLGEETTTTKEDDIGIDAGDLEALFANDGEEEEDTAG